jgi:DNA modification methylase
VGDCLELLRDLPDESINCVVTSPPYWGLRSYLSDGHESKHLELGSERTYQEYVANMVDVFRDVRRVLCADGTLWLNLGDCYATGAGAVGECPGGGVQGDRWTGNRGDRPGSPKHSGGAMGPTTQPNRLPQPGLKPKDLVGIPWRVAFALQDDGWYLRSEIIWHKPNPMPESVTDRPTKSHEQLFLLTKSDRYFYDQDAIREPHAEDSIARVGRGRSDDHKWADGGPGNQTLAKDISKARHPQGRNRRTVWTIPTEPTPDAHFATYPRKLVEPCILAGCPAGGIVLDPFGGSGTTGRVSEDLGRQWLLFDLSPEYAKIAKRKTAQTGLLGRCEKVLESPLAPTEGSP